MRTVTPDDTPAKLARGARRSRQARRSDPKPYGGKGYCGVSWVVRPAGSAHELPAETTAEALRKIEAQFPHLRERAHESD
jgi:hypothetical protein